jgi:hypothetical protein
MDRPAVVSAMGDIPKYEIAVLQTFLNLQESRDGIGIIEPNLGGWLVHTQLLHMLQAKSYLHRLDGSGLSRILHRLCSMNVLERSEGSCEYDSIHPGRVKYRLTPGGEVYARLALRLPIDIRPFPYELEDAIVSSRFGEIREWLTESMLVRDSIDPHGLVGEPLKVSVQGGTYSQNFVYLSLNQQTDQIKRVGTHFTSQDEENLFEKGATDLTLVTWHTIRNKMRDRKYRRDSVILRIYGKGAPTFAMEKEQVRRKALFYPEGAKQRQSLAKRVAQDANPAEPSQLVPGFADGGYDRIVTQPPNSTIFAAMGNCVGLGQDEEDYFLIASRRLFNPGEANMNVYGLITDGRLASSGLLREGTRYRLARSYVIRDLSAELKRMPRYDELADLLSKIREPDDLAYKCPQRLA